MSKIRRITLALAVRLSEPYCLEPPFGPEGRS
jgi:hypothetical protein